MRFIPGWPQTARRARTLLALLGIDDRREIANTLGILTSAWELILNWWPRE